MLAHINKKNIHKENKKNKVEISGVTVAGLEKLVHVYGDGKIMENNGKN